MIDWSAWLGLLRPISEVSIPRYCFWEAKTEARDDESVSYQLHGFSDASNDALSCVVYLRRLIGRRSNASPSCMASRNWFCCLRRIGRSLEKNWKRLGFVLNWCSPCLNRCSICLAAFTCGQTHKWHLNGL